MRPPSYKLLHICIGFYIFTTIAVAQEARDPFASRWSPERFKHVFADVLFTGDVVKGAVRLTSGTKREQIESELRKLQISYQLPEPVLLPQVVRCLNAEIEAARLNYKVRLELRPMPDEDAGVYFERMLLRAMENDPNRVNAMKDRSLGDILWTTAASVNASIVVYDNGVIVIAHRVGE